MCTPILISMKKQLVTVNLKNINILSTVTFILFVILGVALKLLLFKDIDFGLGTWDYLIVIALCPILFIMHEGVHGLAFIISGAPPTSIKFGAIPKKMMLYCTTCKPITAKQYQISLLSPLIILGIIPYVVSVVILGVEYVLLFALLISGASGDIVMFLELSKYKDAKMILDHPKAPAFYLLYKDDELPVGFKEVTQDDEDKLLEEINSK